MVLAPAQAARWSGEEPFSSALLQDASYVNNSSTMCLERIEKNETQKEKRGKTILKMTTSNSASASPLVKRIKPWARGS